MTILSVEPVRDKRIEASVLNCLMTEEHAVLQVMHLLNDQCFFEEEHLVIYHAILRVLDEGRQPTMMAVYDNLIKTLKQEKVNQIMAATAASVFKGEDMMELDYMVLRLQEYAKRRALGGVISKLSTLLSDMSYPLDQGMREVQECLDNVVFGQQDNHLTLSQELDDLKQIIADNQDDATRHTGILCGIPQIDETGGLPADGLVVIGAKTSHGKTAFSTNLAMEALKQGNRIAFYSMEMSLHKITSRILAMESGVNPNAIMRLKLSEADRQRALDAISRLKASVANQFYFDNSNVTDIMSLELSIRAMKKKYDIKCVVVDYLQLMDDIPGKRNLTDNKKYAYITRQLHNLGRDLGICTILLSQVNRSAPGMPTLANLRDSGEIEEAADLVIILYNPDADGLEYFPKPFDDVKAKGKIMVSYGKNRDDAKRSFVMCFDHDEMRIYPLTEKKPQQAPLQQELTWYNEDALNS